MLNNNTFLNKLFVQLAFIFCLVEGNDDAVMYLLAVNLIGKCFINRYQ